MSMRKVENPSLVKKKNIGEDLKFPEFHSTPTPYAYATTAIAGFARSMQYADLYSFGADRRREVYNGYWTSSTNNGRSTNTQGTGF